MRSFHRENIDFTIVKLDSNCDTMIRIMQQCHPKAIVTDLEHATKTKSRSEVDKMFVDTASFILRAQVGGSKSSSSGTKAPLWDPAQLQVTDVFSCASFVKVTAIDGNKVTVKNHLGGSWLISRDLIEREIWSADHFSQEVKCTMTDLSEILGNCKDTVFTVQFRKQVAPKTVSETLAKFPFKDLREPARVKQLTKDVLEGETVRITGRLVESENHLGRSLVIDLKACPNSNSRQVDHRSIDWIIFRNAKYSLGRRAPGTGELPLKYNRADEKWEPSKLAEGNWFSSSSYYKVKQISDAQTCIVVTPDNTKKPLTMSRDIMEREMYSGTVFGSVEYLPRAGIVGLLANAKECVFTVTFHKQLDRDLMKAKLRSLADSFDEAKKSGKLSDMSSGLLLGPECSLTCRLSQTEHKLGRSTVIDLNAPWGMNYRQVDHRTISGLILKNVKYLIKN